MVKHIVIIQDEWKVDIAENFEFTSFSYSS